MNKKIKVGYMGPEGSFGHVAAIRFSQESNINVELVPFKTHNEVCRMVGKNEVKYGVVAVENVIDGMVSETLRAIDDANGRYSIIVCAEVAIPVKFYFQNISGNIGDVKLIKSHTVGIKQCSDFLSRIVDQYPKINYLESPSTAAAAEEASLDKTIAALASEDAGKRYHLKKIEEKNQTDHPNSHTRFWVLDRELKNPTGSDKTSFLINLRQEAIGGLHKTLRCFSDNKVNVCVMHSIPIPGKLWEYSFLIEVQGHIFEKNIEDAYNQFRKEGISLNPPRFIGSYPNDATITP